MALADSHSTPSTLYGPTLLETQLWRRFADMLEPRARRAIAHVRANPRPYVIGAVGLAVAGAAIALFSNRKVRESGAALAARLRRKGA